MLPPLRAPYLIFVCFARSSALSIGESILSTVRNAAKLAVYEEIMIKVKNHHMPATMRVDTALGKKNSGGAVGYFALAFEPLDSTKLRERILKKKRTSYSREDLKFLERMYARSEVSSTRLRFKYFERNKESWNHVP